MLITASTVQIQPLFSCCCSRFIMQAEKQQQQTWKITVQAKTKKSFNFKFKSTQIVPTCKFHRFSLLIKLRKIILRVKLNSESTASSVSRKRKATLRSKLLRIFKKIGIPCTKNRDHTIHNPESQSPLLRLKQHVCKEPISVATLCTGILVFLAQSIFSIVQKGFVVYSLATLLFFFSVVSGKYNVGRILKFLVILMLAASTSSSELDFNNYIKFFGRYVSDYIGKASNYAALVFMN
ncbi:uncharacterized protein LOC133723923 [Rosa rugosa]|uniref:uncharacterized protein LOC133723923 n=1 Tax=Rosa rugosa TaxID=74645 RepID=UPI002B40E8FC|nr:uncharacterized protein LOC133723923 [Rosa rugosa]